MSAPDQTTQSRAKSYTIVTPATPEQEGYAAFGCGASNPYPLHSQAHVQWWRGWIEAKETVGNERA